MKENKLWLVLIPVVLVAMICIGAAGVIMLRDNTEKDYTALIHRAQEAVDSGDYDAAISAYEKAIKLDSKEIRAYRGLAELHIVMGEPEEAVKVGQRYKEATGDATLENKYNEALREMLEKATQQEASTGEGIISFAGEKENTPSEQVELNASLVAFISGASYADYEQAYGASTIDYNGSGSVLHYSQAPIVCSYMAVDGAVRVDSAGKPFTTSYPTAVSLTDLSLLLVGMTGSVSLDVLNAAPELGDAHMVSEDGHNVVTFSVDSCEVKIACDENGTIQSTEAWNEITITEPAQETQNCTLSGTVQDATTGSGVSRAKLLFRKGIDNTLGNADQEVEASANGEYSVELESGDYTVEIQANGYITECFAVTVYAWFTTDERDFTLSPELEEDQIRIVLEWGAAPRDLDSYLVGTSTNGERVNVNFMSKSLEGVAALDVDDMDGYGPETVTIYDIGGAYQFIVHDFEMTGTMAQSGATVKIYMPGESQPTIVTVPSDVENDWLVCEINGKQLSVINRAYNNGS